MKASIQQLTIAEKEWLFFFDFEDRPCIEVEGITYSCNVWADLFDNFFVLFQSELDKAAQVINFLAFGLEYAFIEHLESFQEGFQQRIENDKKYNYARFDTSKMHPPQITNSHFVFFVMEEHTQLPYRVSITFPFIEGISNIRYELLPYLHIPAKNQKLKV
jgi:hypothetical protein